MHRSQHITISLVLSIYLTFLLGSDTIVAEERRISTCLQILYTADRSECFELVASCTADSTPAFSLENHAISDVTLVVKYQKIGYQQKGIAYRRTFELSKKIKTTNVLPVWDGGYIPSDTFLLPSGRLYFDPSGALQLLVIHENRPGYLRFDRETSEFISSPANAKDTERLKELYVDSFATNDIYWSYFLVAQAKTLGVEDKGARIDFSSIVDTKVLHTLWRERAAHVR